MIFQPQNVMGPANRGNVIQQLAQGAAQNVMRRQKMRALLAHTRGFPSATRRRDTRRVFAARRSGPAPAWAGRDQSAAQLGAGP